jgi:hypothetical protein
VSHTPAVIAHPDIEAWVWASLRGLGGVTMWCYAAERMWPNWLVAYSLQVDARAGTKQAARDRAERARQIMEWLPNLAWADGVLSYSQPVEGPFWLPDDDGQPRYVARYELRAHPGRQWAGGQVVPQPPYHPVPGPPGPAGPPGPPGPPLTILGTVTEDQLPAQGEPGQAWIVDPGGYLYVWRDGQWRRA